MQWTKESNQEKVTLLPAKLNQASRLIKKVSGKKAHFVFVEADEQLRITSRRKSMRSLSVCHNCCLWKRLPLRGTNSPKLLFPFGSAHASYHDLQCDEDDIQVSLDYYNGECKRIKGSQLTLDQCIAKAWSEYYENVDNAVQPEDSVSNVSSRCSFRSRVSHASSRKLLSGSSSHQVQSPLRIL